jgi:glycosyltransferase involved in cell wall biosynthesis
MDSLKHVRRARPKVAFVCPFNLDRLSGTPIRARITIEAITRDFETLAIATGGSGAMIRTAFDSWDEIDNRQRFRLDRFISFAIRALREFRPHVLHAFTTAAVPAAVVHKITHSGVRTVFESHGSIWREMAGRRIASRTFLGALDQIGMRCSDRIVVMSYSQRRSLPFSSSRRKASVIWGPVDLNAFRIESPPPTPPLVVGYLGNAHPWQGINTIVAAARLLEENEGVRFILGGLSQGGQQLLPRNVTFVPHVPREITGRFVSQCHVLLSPRMGGAQTDTQYPSKLSTYLACGRPVIGSDVNDQGTIIRETACGFVFSPGDAEQLAAAISKVADLELAARIEMGIRARDFAERYLSIETLRDRLARLYMEDLS